jgi:hypothetical protein
VPLLQLSAVMPPLNALMRISVASAASTARGEAESIFSSVDQEQQQRVSVLGWLFSLIFSRSACLDSSMLAYSWHHAHS